jgi:two-component system heavy metal sensor histidine kinase CusS
MFLKQTNSSRGKPSLTARLSRWFAFSTFFLLAIVIGLSYWALLLNFDRDNDQYLSEKEASLRALFSDPSRDPATVRWEVEEESATHLPVRVLSRVIGADGLLVGETAGMTNVLPSTVFSAATSGAEQPAAAEIRSGNGRTFRVLSSTVAGNPPGRRPFVIQVAVDLTGQKNLLRGYRNQLWIVLGVGLIVSTLIGHRIARTGIRPITEMARAVCHVRASTLHERIPLESVEAELSILGENFNQTLDSLEDAFARLSRFSSDIAHELRTPVNNMRGELEVALRKVRSADEYREVMESSLEECQRLSRLIARLLFLARAEHPEMQISRERLDIGGELQRIAEFYEAMASERGIALTVRTMDRVAAEVDRTLFQRAIANLVENALRYTPKDGEVVVAAEPFDGELRIMVTDTGLGIPRDQVEHVFERFYRVDSGRARQDGGTGLGLAIVQSIARLHGGSVKIENNVERGTRVTMIFPLVPAGTPACNAG